MTKNLSKIKGTLHGWNSQSAKWYDDASAYTGYHDKLSRYILRYIKPEYTCFEIACGTGNLARVIAPHCSGYTAADVDENAISFFRKKLAGEGEPDIKVICSDWKKALGEDQYDVIIESYFGVKTADWELLQNAARHMFIAVVPRDRSMAEGEGISKRHNERLESFDQMERFFTERGMVFEAFPLDIEFGQPFSDIEEARDYVRYYYKLDEEDIERFIDMKLTRQDDGMLYFPKTKKIVMIAVHTD